MSDPEPYLPLRCGTFYFRSTREEQERMRAAWDRQDQAWLDWYQRQPADQLTERHHERAEHLHHVRKL